MSVDDTSSERAAVPSARAILAVCGIAGAACAVALWFNPQVVVALFVLAVLSVAALLLLKPAILFILLPAVFSLLLLNRFDEGFALSIAPPIALPASLWTAMFFALGLGVAVLLNREKTPSVDPVLGNFNYRFARRWALFCALGGISLLFNRFTDDGILQRDVIGEVLALCLVAFPLAFVMFIPRSRLSRSQTLFCLRALVAMAAFAGLIMTLFGLLPDSLIGGLGWSQAIGGTSDLVRGRLPMGHPNRVAAMMLTLFPFAALTAMGGRGFFWRVFCAAGAALIFCGVLFSLSRAALLNMIAILGLIYLMFFFTQKHRRGLGILLILFSGIVVVAMSSILIARYDFSRFWSRGYYEDASVSRRQDSLRTSFQVWIDHPLLGIGPDALYTRLDLRPGWTPPMSDTISPIIYYKGMLTAETPHNFYTHVLAEFGLLGGLVFFSLLWMMLRAIWHARGTPGLDLAEKEELTGLALGVVAMLIAGMFEAVFMAGTRANILFWIYAGLAVRYAMLLSAEAAARAEPAP